MTWTASCLAFFTFPRSARNQILTSTPGVLLPGASGAITTRPPELWWQSSLGSSGSQRGNEWCCLCLIMTMPWLSSCIEASTRDRTTCSENCNVRTCQLLLHNEARSGESFNVGFTCEHESCSCVCRYKKKEFFCENNYLNFSASLQLRLFHIHPRKTGCLRFLQWQIITTMQQKKNSAFL